METTQTAVVENRLSGKKATIEYNRQSRRAVLRESAEKQKGETKKASPKAASKKTKEAKIEETKKLTDTEQKVLDFITNLDHPATSNEVRDKFHFKLRANARAIFKKLQRLGYGENRKGTKRYEFYVKGKEYPPPKTEPKKA
jgi:hypothetical protein